MYTGKEKGVELVSAPHDGEGGKEAFIGAKMDHSCGTSSERLLDSPVIRRALQILCPGVHVEVVF